MAIESLTVRIQLLKMACLNLDGPQAHWIAEIDEASDQLERQLRQDQALRARYPQIAEEQSARSVRRVQRLFRLNEEPTGSLTRLSEWKSRGLTADEVRQDGAYPDPGTLELRRGPD